MRRSAPQAGFHELPLRADWKRRRRALVVVLLLAGWWNASGAQPALATPNILLIVSEDHSPQLGCYGDSQARTPHLDALARDGVRFERAFVTFSVCSPSRASFLTGLYPHQNGQLGLASLGFTLYDRDSPNVFSRLRRAGYRTGLIGKLHVSPESAFPIDYEQIRVSNFNRRDVAEYAAAAKNFFDKSDQPFFLSVNYPDAHLPFLAEQFGRPVEAYSRTDTKPLAWVGVDSPRLREVTADYYNCLARLDDGVGLLLDALDQSGKAENTLVVFFSDHGAQFPRGKYTVHEGGLRIPFLVRWPGHAQPGLVRQELVSTVDVLPTLLASAGIPVEKSLPGMDLAPLLQPGEIPWREYVFGMTTGAMPNAFHLQWSVRNDRYKLILNATPGRENPIARSQLGLAPTTLISHFTAEELSSATPTVNQAFDRFLHPPEVQLYDLQADPSEWTNLADDSACASVRRELLAALQDFREQTGDPFLDVRNLQQFEEGLLSLSAERAKESGFLAPYAESFSHWRRNRLNQ